MKVKFLRSLGEKKNKLYQKTACGKKSSGRGGEGYTEERGSKTFKGSCSFFSDPPHRRVNGGLGGPPGFTIPGTTCSHPGQGSMKTSSLPML